MKKEGEQKKIAEMKLLCAKLVIISMNMYNIHAKDLVEKQQEFSFIVI